VGFYVANGLGESIDAPTFDQMAEFLRNLDVADEEHGAAWISTDEGYSLEWSGDGRLVLGRPNASQSVHLRAISRDRALELWTALARGHLAEVEACPWQPGNGFVQTPEQAATIRDWQLRQDREFYDVLGNERSDVPCREPGCKRGAIELSVLCRVHHFESVKKRPSPFDD
jgi:hypothetical protein